MSFKPTIELVPLQTALAWRGAGFLYEEKIDGCFAELPLACGSVIIGERTGGQFWPFDVVRLAGQDARQWPLEARRRALDDICAQSGHPWPRPRVGHGGEFLEAILADGGEGIVAKPWGAPYGCGWLKAKRCQTFYCAVTRKAGDGRQVIGLGIIPPFQDVKNWAVSRREKLADAGNMKLSDDKFNLVRLGSILKIEAFGQHPSGRLREARLDRDAPGSWLVKF